MRAVESLTHINYKPPMHTTAKITSVKDLALTIKPPLATARVA